MPQEPSQEGTAEAGADQPATEKQAAEKPTRRSPLRLALVWMIAALYVGWVIGQSLRDRTLLSALGFYVPSPVLAGLLSVGLVASLVRKQRTRTVVLLLLALPVFGVVGLWENRWSQPDPEEVAGATKATVVHWNVNGGMLGWEAIAAEIHAASPDLIILSESPSEVDGDEIRARFGEQFYGIQFGRLRAIANSTIDGRRWIYRDRGLQVGVFNWLVGERTLTVFVVDILADPFALRDPLLQELRTLMEQHSPDLVVGDFNSPRRSLALDPLPTGWRHAYDVAGSGWSYTWPTPLPVYAIDQAIVKDSVHVLDYRLETSWLSDHRRQVFDLAVPGNGQPK